MFAGYSTTLPFAVSAVLILMHARPCSILSIQQCQVHTLRCNTHLPTPHFLAAWNAGGKRKGKDKRDQGDGEDAGGEAQASQAAAKLRRGPPNAPIGAFKFYAEDLLPVSGCLFASGCCGLRNGRVLERELGGVHLPAFCLCFGGDLGALF